MLQRLILAVAVTFIASSGVARAQGDAVGHWSGRAAYQRDELPIELTFESAATGLQGYFSAPTIRAYRYPLRNVSQEAGELTFELVGDASTFAFRGRLDGNSLTGSWNLFGVDADVTVARTLPAAAPYVRESATCRNGEVSLAGSIFLPSGTGPHPAVVFAHGSGAETRDASNFFADRLARAGIVAFTFDKRGAGASTGNWRDADFADLAGDVLACVGSLKARRDVDARRIGLAGASQAGWVAALAASRSTDIAFMALVSGPAVPVWKEGWWDTEFRLRDGGFAAADVTKAQAILRLNDEVTRTGAGFAELTRLIEAAKPEPWFRALGFQQAPPSDAPFAQRAFPRRDYPTTKETGSTTAAGSAADRSR